MTLLDIALPARDDALAWRNREWLLTNGLGGYASGTLASVCTRRYHGMFVPNLSQPRGRHVLVSRLDEEMVIDGQTICLGGSDRPGERFALAACPYLTDFQLDGNTARWVFECDSFTLVRQMVMPHQRNTCYLRYELLRGPAMQLRLRPFMPFRRQDAPLRRGRYGPVDVARTDDGGRRFSLSGTELSFVMNLADGEFVAAPKLEPDAWLWREDIRGYESLETLVNPGFFECEIAPGMPRLLILTTEDGPPPRDPDAPFAEEKRRIAALVSRAGGDADPFVARLAVAADQFLILPENRVEESVEAAQQGHALRTVAAGYHWFLDWGRDTMISLEGLMLSTGRHAEARATLLTFANYVRDGLLPNLFPEGSREGWYHTVDATLWYFHAIHRYVLTTCDRELLDQLLPVLREILRKHLQGTRFHIGVDPEDGLLRASTPEHALTWMDAHMGEWIVTPRRGKPVEIQALWYNALCLMAKWEGGAEGATYAALSSRVRESFNRKFWNDAERCLFDVVEGEGGNDARLRPNQLFAISLDHPVLDASRWLAVLERVAGELLTPVGLRTLAPSDPDYAANYAGNLQRRDAAYHQGTVWPWLLGAYVDAVLKVNTDPQQARSLLKAFPAHLQVAGVGSISEVFDGKAPHAPHGCIAQAWSVAEVLRSWKKVRSRSADSLTQAE